MSPDVAEMLRESQRGTPVVGGVVGAAVEAPARPVGSGEVSTAAFIAGNAHASAPTPHRLAVAPTATLPFRAPVKSLAELGAVAQDPGAEPGGPGDDVAAAISGRRICALRGVGREPSRLSAHEQGRRGWRDAMG